MRITCPTCSNANTISDDEIKGKIFSLVCEACEQLISVKISVSALNIVRRPQARQVEKQSKNKVSEFLYENLEKLKLPVLPVLATKIQQARQNERCSIQDIVDLVRTDQIIATKILELANSALYGGLIEITDLKQAIVKLGLTITETLVQALENKRIYTSDNRYVQKLLKQLWLHALGVAMTAQKMAEELGEGKVEEVFTAGLLHDFGYVLFVQALLQADHFKVDLQKLDNKEFMDIAFEDHTKIGAKYLGDKGVPHRLVTVVLNHEEIPESEAGNRVLHIVSLANQLCKKVGLGPVHDPEIRLDLTESAQILGFNDLKLADLEVKCEDLVQQVAAMLE